MNLQTEFDRHETTEKLEQYLKGADGLDHKNSKLQFRHWYDDVVSFLKEYFTDNAVADYFANEANLKPSVVYFSGMSEADKIASYDLARARKAIRYILRQMNEAPSADRVPANKRDKFSEKVFIVHGHDETKLLEVKTLVERQGLKAVVLRDEPNGGATVIEKFEKNADVGFAVVIMTADDVGSSKASPEELRNRARQNVILELGYFAGHLGRERVCALLEDEMDVPSDILGVVYTKLDEAGAWKYKLADELRHAGYSVDKNLI